MKPFVEFIIAQQEFTIAVKEHYAIGRHELRTGRPQLTLLPMANAKTLIPGKIHYH